MGVVNGLRQARLLPPDTGHEVDRDLAGVVLNRPLNTILTYRVPLELRDRLAMGQRVRVPLGRGNEPAIGYCVELPHTPSPDLDPARVKDLLAILDDPPLIDPVMLELTKWMAGYYSCSWGQALDAVVPAGVKKHAGTALKTCLLVPPAVKLARDTLDLPPRQAAALELLAKADELLTLPDLCRLASCGPSVIAALKKRGLIETVQRRVSRRADRDTPHDEDLERGQAENPPRTLAAPPDLTPDQAQVLAQIDPLLRTQPSSFAACLLHGVTGSGKTEVYLSAIEQVVARGREAIVLVPEISLTPQTIRRFRRRFPRVAVLHSHLSDAERHRHWQSIAAGEVQVVVGARSAVFAPARNLGLIVIDEEHETTFKQETVPRYHARDVAVKRAQMLKIPILLGSATPSLETWVNAEQARYTRLSMPNRVAERPMPKVALIDLRHEKPEPGQTAGALSGPLRRAMRESLDSGGQVILLLNRRGFHTFVVCSACGAVVKCDACDVAMTHHRGRRRLICHMCDAERELPVACPTCREAKLHYGGIGTERLEREVEAVFPDIVCRRMDSDTMRGPGSHEQVLTAFRHGDVRILLGTQMIAKGLDFPNVTLVGVVNADTSLHLPDFRAAERTFQLVAQVAGRTGRGEKPGRVLVQTYSPDEPAILFAARHDYLGFVATEIPRRREFSVPPFGRLVRLIARGPVEVDVATFIQTMAEAFRASFTGNGPGQVKVMGPAPAPVVKIRNLYRYHLQLRADSARPLQHALRSILPGLRPPGEVELAIDVDPISML